MVLVPNSTELIFVDFLENKIRKVDYSQNIFSTLAGTGLVGNNDGAALIASFSGPYSIAIDWIHNPSVAFISEKTNACIRKFDLLASTVSTLTGVCTPTGAAFSFQDGDFTAARFNSPQAIRFLSSSSGTQLIVVDKGFHVIRLIDLSLSLFLKTKYKN